VELVWTILENLNEFFYIKKQDNIMIVVYELKLEIKIQGKKNQ